MMLSHHAEHLTHSRIRMDGDRVIDHSVLCPLYTADLVHLLLNGHVLVDHTDTAGTGHSDSKLSFGHGVHCCRNDRSLESDLPCELC